LRPDHADFDLIDLSGCPDRGIDRHPKKGYLSVEMKREGKRAWREHSATKEGKKVLNAAKRKLHELME